MWIAFFVYLRYRVLFSIFLGIIFIFSIVFLAAFPANTAYAQTGARASFRATNCPAPAQPGPNSLLIVLLDRSGSLVQPVDQSPATDPDGYSTSATRALADLWPGRIAVIPFGNGGAPVLGPVSHSNTQDLDTLKRSIPDAQENADTPLGLAMEHAQTLMKQGGAPPCSKVVLVTDGAPTGPQGRIDDIRNTFVPWFKQQGIPVNVFGLKIDKGSEDGQAADSLLTFIAKETGVGPAYDQVQNAHDLAVKVVSLYSHWRSFTFTPYKKDTLNGNYPLVIDERVDAATIITFFPKGMHTTPLTTKSGVSIASNKVEIFKDTHYEIDHLQPKITADTYIMNVEGTGAEADNPDAVPLVFALIDSELKLTLVQKATDAYTDQLVPIEAHFVDNTGAVIPAKNKPFSGTATVVTTLKGQKPISKTVDLTQEQPGSDLLKGSFAIPNPGLKPGKERVYIGNIQISAVATYNDATRSTDTSITESVYVPQLPPPPPYVCRKSQLQCFIEQYRTQLTIAVPLLLITLLLLLLWPWPKSPFGWLVDPLKASKAVPLKGKRSFTAGLFRRPVVVFSNTLVHNPQVVGSSLGKLAGMNCLFVYKRDGNVYLKATGREMRPISVETNGQQTALDKAHPEAKLTRGSNIKVGGELVGSFQLTAPQRAGNGGLFR